jgi:hypothetical protein
MDSERGDRPDGPEARPGGADPVQGSGGTAMVAIVMFAFVVVFVLLSVQPEGTPEQVEPARLDFPVLTTAR